MSLKTMVVSPAKLTILISWLHISISFTLVSAIMKLASTSATMMYSNIEIGDPWQTTSISVSGSDRRPFIFILDWMLL